MPQSGFKFLTEISHIFSDYSRASSDETFNTLLAKIGSFSSADRSWIIQLRKEQAFVTHEWCKDGIPSGLQIDEVFPMNELAWFTEKLFTEGLLCIEDTNSIPESAVLEREVCSRQMLKGILAFPIKLDNVPVAIIGIDMVNKSQTFSETLIESLKVVSLLVSPILHREKLTASKEELDLRFRTVLDNLTEGVSIGDLDDTIIYVNHRYAQMLGYLPEEILGKQAYKFLIPIEEQHKISEGTSRRRAGQSDSYEVTQLSKSGKPLSTIINACPYRNVHGEVVGNIACHIDITEQKKSSTENGALQQHLFQLQKMEAVGQLAAGLAHDLNNHLTAVVGHLNLIKLNSEISDQTRESADAALLGCHVASDMIKQLLSFSSQAELAMTKVSLKSVVDSCIELSRGILGKQTSVKMSGQVLDHLIFADKNQLSQVITNLIINAIHAMPNGGTIGFHYSVSEVDQVKFCNPIAEPGRYVVLTVSDTGCGIKEEYLSKIFEPFFTTKKNGTGTGLGLSMAYAIVQKHGGWIEVDSQVGSGTVFSLYLPLAGDHDKGSLDAQVSVSREQDAPLGTILVIDDEPVLAELACSFLQRAGFKTFSFSDPFEAFTWYQKHQGTVSLILLDMKMPGCSGAESFEKLKAINPDAQIVLISGYVDDLEVSRLLSRGALSFIQKPIKYSELVDWIAKTVKISHAGASIEPLFH
jgi:two-component system cell cycle sensor histidine kinase/response regulator CckA